MKWLSLALMGLLCTTFALGCGVPSFLITPVQNTSRIEEQQVVEAKGFAAPKIAIIEIEGMLLNMKGGGLLQPTENPVSRFKQELDTAAKDSSVKAVVLRVNSPGGAVAASDIMYQSLVRFRQQTKKPVVASLQDVAASGGYYVACGADRIIAHPTAVVGSIGVIFTTFTIEGTLNKVGARVESIKSGPLKDMGSPFRDLDPQARAVMQGLVDEYYGRFLSIVSAHRKLTEGPGRSTTVDGRVFSGTRAVELGLADATGLLDDAVEEAKKLAKITDASVVIYRRPYGYGGSIYAESSTPAPRAGVLQLSIPGLSDRLPTGFYYLWVP